MTPKITYCEGEGDAAILADYDDGRGYGFAHMGGRWRGDLHSVIFHKAKVIGEAAFHRTWPGLALPTLPE